MGKIKGFLFAVRHREILMTDLGLSLPDDFQLRSYLRLQRDAVDTLTLALVSYVRIDLSGFHVLVSNIYNIAKANLEGIYINKLIIVE